MRLFATLALIAAALFWSHPFLPTDPVKSFFAQAMPGQKSVKPPVLVRAPAQNGGPAGDTVISSATRSSEDPRR
jgi:hypothetical protein